VYFDRCTSRPTALLCGRNGSPPPKPQQPLALDDSTILANMSSSSRIMSVSKRILVLRGSSLSGAVVTR